MPILPIPLATAAPADPTTRKISSAQLPEEIDVRLAVLGDTPAELAQANVAQHELVIDTATRQIAYGDGQGGLVYPQGALMPFATGGTLANCTILCDNWLFLDGRTGVYEGAFIWASTLIASELTVDGPIESLGLGSRFPQIQQMLVKTTSPFLVVDLSAFPGNNVITVVSQKLNLGGSSAALIGIDFYGSELLWPQMPQVGGVNALAFPALADVRFKIPAGFNNVAKIDALFNLARFGLPSKVGVAGGGVIFYYYNAASGTPVPSAFLPSPPPANAADLAAIQAKNWTVTLVNGVFPTP